MYYLLFLFIVAVLADLPPQSPPESLVNDYTLNGSIPIELYYVDDTMGGKGTHFKYQTRSIESFVAGANKIFKKIQSGLDKFPLTKDNKDDFIHSLPKDQWIHFAMLKYQQLFNNSIVSVIGSMEPWVEASAVAMDCSKVITLEYNNLTYNHSKIVTIDGSKLESYYDPSSIYYNSIDISISISSFDHDGLGRYGDPLNPNGDLESMQLTFNMLKPGGLLFVTVPVGPDVVVFNLHRRYGPIRLPMLLTSAGWEIIDRLGWIEEKLTTPANWRQTYEPVFVLRKPLTENVAENKGTLDKEL